MKFKIRKLSIFKAQLHKIQKVMGVAAIKFNEDCIKIRGMNNDGVLACQLLIAKDNLIGYEYKPRTNIAVNLNGILIALEQLEGDVEFSVKGSGLSVSAGNKRFDIGSFSLDDRSDFPEFKPKVKWNVNEKIGEIKRIFTYMDDGPLIINSVHDGYDLSWIVAPTLQRQPSAYRPATPS